jgi:hypothetical protein
MTLPRAVGLVLILTTIAAGAVWLRMERIQMAHEIHVLAAKEVTLLRAIDESRAMIARLRAPERIRERVAEMQLTILPPEAQTSLTAGDRLAGEKQLPSKRRW